MRKEKKKITEQGREKKNNQREKTKNEKNKMKEKLLAFFLLLDLKVNVSMT